ncbi:ABC transporter substrate-binding protein [Brevibacterium album]|uniref:ABC transporter substrate-binding protein n=1 Tax=Brevibacterium album TaxID=417948 RepID=UPI00041BB01A|nr:ABC transporter substrate-binding protein [Brevibacterium album]
MTHSQKSTRRHSRLIASAALASASLMVLSACGSGDASSADSDEPIPIGIIADRSGATGDVGAPYNDGMLAYIEQLNAAGGIEGREIEAHSNDYAYEIPQAEELYRRYVNDGVVAIMGWGTGDTEALRTRVANDELPFMSGSFSEELTVPEESPYNFLVAPTYSDQMRVALNWIAQDAGGETGVAVLHNDSPFGTSPVADGEAWVEEQGLDIDYVSHAMPAGTTNFAGVLSQVDSAGAEYIVVQNVASPAAQLARDLAAQGGEQKIICLNWCGNELFITSAGDAAEGHLMVQPIAPISAEKPGHEAIAAYLEEQGQDSESAGVSYVQGWYTMHVMAEGIRHTLEAGEDLTGAAIRESLETMGAVDTGEVIGGGPVEFSPESHRGSVASNVYEVQDGRMVEVEAGATP